MKWTTRDLQYFAGLFDGEGSIMIYGRRGKVPPKTKTVPYNVRIQMTNTHQGVMKWVHQTFGGNLFPYKTVRGNRALGWKWTAYAGVAAPLLTALLPHLIVKQAQAELALEFQTHLSTARYKNHKKGVRGALPIPAAEIAWRERACEQMLQLRRDDKHYPS